VIRVGFSKHGFEMKGHSGYAEAGSDIVCAAVSAMVRLAINIITEGFNAAHSLQVSEKEADLSFEMKEQSEEGSRVLEILKADLKQLEAEYPKNISIL